MGVKESGHTGTNVFGEIGGFYETFVAVWACEWFLTVMGPLTS
jgi:hypothetical protein